MSGPVKRGEVRDLLVEHAEEAELGEGHAARFGARKMTAADRRAMLRTDDDRPVVAAWARSAAHAWRVLALVRDQGASLRSTCDPDRANRVQTSSDPSLGGREHDLIERVSNVSRAIDRATALPLAISRACPLVTPEQGEAIAWLRVTGRARIDRVAIYGRKQKGRYLRRDNVPIEDVIAAARREMGVELERRHVRELADHWLSIIERDLVASGELAPPARPIARRRGFAADPAARIRRGARPGEEDR